MKTVAEFAKKRSSVIRVNFSREGSATDRWMQMIETKEFDYIVGYDGEPLRCLDDDGIAGLLRLNIHAV